MDEPVNGLKFLDELREKTGKQNHSFQKLQYYLGIKAREKGIPVSGKFELTPLCNFNCKMCYIHLTENQLKGQTILPVETWKNLIHQAWEAGMVTSTLTGGECLTYPGFEELYLYLHSLGCEVSVLTNGYLLDEKKILFFKNHLPAAVQVTLYGWNDDVYERVTGQRAFTTVSNNIKRALEAGIPVYIAITPNKYLGEDLLETIRVAKDLCKTVIINSVFTTPREETGRSEQQDDIETELYIRAYKYYMKLDGHETTEIREEALPPCGGSSHEASECGLQCGGGRSSFTIDWKGTMMPCSDLTMIRSYPLRDGFTAAWTKVNQAANQWPRVPECSGCAYERVCHHCAANVLRYAEPGRLPAGLCERTRELVRNGVAQLPDCK